LIDDLHRTRAISKRERKSFPSRSRHHHKQHKTTITTRSPLAKDPHTSLILLPPLPHTPTQPQLDAKSTNQNQSRKLLSSSHLPSSSTRKEPLRFFIISLSLSHACPPICTEGGGPFS
jgi:hypothetical protein